MTTPSRSQARQRVPQPGLREHLASLAWAIVLGAVSGLACVAVRLLYRLLQWIFLQDTRLLPQAAAALSPGRRLLTPLLGALAATAVLWAVRRWSRATPFREYVEAVRFDHGHIPFASTLWRTLSSAFSVATGAAIGREGSMIQCATAVTSRLGEWSRERLGTRTLPLSLQVACGAAAAVAAAYHAPLAGIFFATEIVLGAWTLSALPSLLLASSAGWLASGIFMGYGPVFPTKHLSFADPHLLWAVPLALAVGLLSPAYQGLLRSLCFTRRWPLPLAWSGLLVGALSLLRPEIWGNADVALQHVLSGSFGLASIAALLALRLLATAFCVGTGTVGGVFTPTVFAGAALGLLAGKLLAVPDPVLFALVGMSALLAAVTHAPVMAALMAVELTGQWNLLPVLLPLNLAACWIARSRSRHSLYAIATPAPLEPVAVS
jgi:CIC family chloride channel protein